MTRVWDVVVIGAGIIGCAITRDVARRGLRVLTVDAGAVGSGATKASAGVLAPFIEAPHPGPLLELAVRSFALYDAFVDEISRESGMTVEYRRGGTLELANDSGAAARLRELATLAERHGVGAEWLEAAEIRRMEPAVAGGVAGGLRIASQGHVSAPDLTEALARSASRAGAQFLPATPVKNLRPADDGWLIDGGGESFHARQVVIAAGSWSGHVGAIGCPVKPIRGQLLVLRTSGRVLNQVVWSDTCYLVPWEDGTVLIGATVEDVGFDARPTAAGVRDLLESACEVVPALWGATFDGARAGLRPATPDGLPLLGPDTERPGLVYATGHYRNGVLLAPLTARLIGDWLVDNRLDPALNGDPHRFRTAPRNGDTQHF